MAKYRDTHEFSTYVNRRMEKKMTYTINWSSQPPYNNDTGQYAAANIGKTQINITNNTTNNQTSIVLTGQGWSGYGQIQQENYIRLMESFASESQPTNATVGQ